MFCMSDNNSLFVISQSKTYGILLSVLIYLNPNGIDFSFLNICSS